MRLQLLLLLLGCLIATFDNERMAVADAAAAAAAAGLSYCQIWQ